MHNFIDKVEWKETPKKDYGFGLNIQEFIGCGGRLMTDLNRRIGDKPFIVEVGEIESVDIDEAED